MTWWQRTVMILALGVVGVVGSAGQAGVARAVPEPARDAASWGLPTTAQSPVAGDPEIIRGFDPPAQRWQSGHRGIDLAAPAGAEVRATAGGRVTFAGRLAGRGVVVVDHGEVRTTYEPVTALRSVGDEVSVGDLIGRLEPGHDCGRPGTDCLHLGLRRGEAYLDPALLLGGARAVRLLPTDARVGVLNRARERAQAAAAAPVSAGSGPAPPPGSSGFVRPATGPVTSRFGMRRHPVLGVWKLHDGLDFGSGCGTPLRAIAPGRVTQAYYNAGYGNRLFIDHGVVDGRTVVSSYNHAIRYTVSPGQQVGAGQTIGLSGTTGYSTGCHLHFMLWIDGRLVDPEAWL